MNTIIFDIIKKVKKDRMVNLQNDYVYTTIEKMGAQDWFYYVYKNRPIRWDIWKPCDWLNANVSVDSTILETGCGCGLNLLWLGQHGFKKLYGSDIDVTALNVGKAFGKVSNIPVLFLLDDCLNPEIIPQDIIFDVIIALNWTHLTDDFDLEVFLKTYAPYLSDNGLIIIDFVDSSYNKVKYNECCTNDLTKPTEYKKRYSKNEADSIAKKANYILIDTLTEPYLYRMYRYYINFKSNFFKAHHRIVAPKYVSIFQKN